MNKRRFIKLLATLPLLASRWFTSAQSPPHHKSDGTFSNSNGVAMNKPFTDLLKWRSQAPDTSMMQFPLAAVDIDFLQQNRTARTLTWIGHCSFLLQIGGHNILTDPQFSSRASPLPFMGPKRGTPPAIQLPDLPPIDVVLISHNHYDHLDAASITALQKHHQPLFIVPLKLSATLRDMGATQILEMDWGQQHQQGGVRLIAEPSYHWSARGMFDKNKTLWANFVIEHEGFRLLFIGDTGYSKDYVHLGKKYGGFDYAIIPIGAYAPRWFMKEVHINPAEAVQIFQDLKAVQAVASHWGTFILTDEPMDEPPQKLSESLAAANIADNRFTAWQHGESHLI